MGIASEGVAARPRQASFLGTLKGLGALTDDPKALARAAEDRVNTAISKSDDEDPQRVDLRLAAELAALALDSAVEVAVGRTSKGDRERRTSLSQVARAVDRDLVRRVEEVRKVLHGQCYHNDVFKSGQRTRVANAVGRARELVEVILLARGRTK